MGGLPPQGGGSGPAIIPTVEQILAELQLTQVQLAAIKTAVESAKRIGKTQDTSLLVLTLLTDAPRVSVSSVLSVTTALAATIFVHIGRQTESAFTAGVNVRIEASSKSSGDGHWYIVAQFRSALGSSVASEAVNGVCASGQNVVPLASTTGFAVDDIVFIHNTTLANSEFGRVTAVSTNISITIEDNLVHAQTGSTVYNQSEFYMAQVDCTAIGRLRVVINGSNAGQNFAVSVDAITGDSMT